METRKIMIIINTLRKTLIREKIKFLEFKYINEFYYVGNLLFHEKVSLNPGMLEYDLGYIDQQKIWIEDGHNFIACGKNFDEKFKNKKIKNKIKNIWKNINLEKINQEIDFLNSRLKRLRINETYKLIKDDD